MQTLVERKQNDLTSLQPGQGLIAAVPSPLGSGRARHRRRGRQGHAGRRQRGRRAVASAVEHAGITLSGVGDQVARYLTPGRRRSSVGQLDRRRQRSPRSRERWRPRGGDAAAASRRSDALEDLDRLHRRGLEPQTLNFAEIADHVELWATAAARRPRRCARRSERAHADAADRSQRAGHRFARRSRPASRRAPGAGGKAFDLSNPYSIDGWFGDSYADLIPDRIDTTRSSARRATRSAPRTSPRVSVSKPPASRCRSPSRRRGARSRA